MNVLGIEATTKSPYSSLVPGVGGAAISEDPREKAQRKIKAKAPIANKAKRGPKAKENALHAGTRQWCTSRV